MEQFNKGMFVPYYIFEEIVEYLELSAKGHCKCMKWENIKSLLNLAVVSSNISSEQAEYLKEKFCREKIKNYQYSYYIFSKCMI